MRQKVQREDKVSGVQASLLGVCISPIVQGLSRDSYTVLCLTLRVSFRIHPYSNLLSPSCQLYPWTVCKPQSLLPLHLGQTKDGKRPSFPHICLIMKFA